MCMCVHIISYILESVYVYIYMYVCMYVCNMYIYLFLSVSNELQSQCRGEHVSASFSWGESLVQSCSAADDERLARRDVLAWGFQWAGSLAF